MAGYIGSKSSVTQVDGYNRTEADAEFVNDPNSVITVSGSNVGIGTSSPSEKLTVAVPSNSGGALFYGGTQSDRGLSLSVSNAGGFDNSFWYLNQTANNSGSTLAFGTRNAEAMRIDSSGNLLVGKTSPTISSTGVELRPNGQLFATQSANYPLLLNRTTSDGSIAEFRKDGTTVGSIDARSGSNNIAINSASNSGRLSCGGSEKYGWNLTNFWSVSDNTNDLGINTNRWDDIYATNGTIQTSDRNEKQDIEVLSDAETRVAQACKGLLRKFRWQDAVAEKGDDARIHFGIIAQDLQDAFAAEGLDAGRYAMFISNTWWETQTDVPAVEAVDAVYKDVVIPAVLDEEGNELEAERTEQQLVTEAVEAKEAYTRTDTYETQAEAPEGATERTRLGVRYPELLAFIIGAM
jgi:hypothetical protein